MHALEEKLAAARRAKDAQSEFAHPRRSRCRSTVGEQTPFAHAAKVTKGRRIRDLDPCRIATDP